MRIVAASLCEAPAFDISLSCKTALPLCICIVPIAIAFCCERGYTPGPTIARVLELALDRVSEFA